MQILDLLVPPYTRTATRSVDDVGFCGEMRQSSYSLDLAAVAIAPRRRASPATVNAAGTKPTTASTQSPANLQPNDPRRDAGSACCDFFF
jgi:hypothetical protein